MTAFAPHPAGTDDLVKRLMAENLSQEIEYINRIDQLEDELTRANAATAAAYEVAAGCVGKMAEDALTHEAHEHATQCEEAILALATPDHSAALDRLIAEAEARVWKEAEKVARDTATCLMPSGHFLSERCADAILAASKKGSKP